MTAICPSVIWEVAQPARRRQPAPVVRSIGRGRLEPFVLEVADDATDCIEWRLPPVGCAGTIWPRWSCSIRGMRPWPNDLRPARPHLPAAARRHGGGPGGGWPAPAATSCRPSKALAWVLYTARTDCGGSLARFIITLRRERSARTMAQPLQWADAVRALGDESLSQRPGGAFDGQFLGRWPNCRRNPAGPPSGPLARRARSYGLSGVAAHRHGRTTPPLSPGAAAAPATKRACGRCWSDAGAKGRSRSGPPVVALFAARAATDFLRRGRPHGHGAAGRLLEPRARRRFIARDNYLHKRRADACDRYSQRSTSEWIDICPNNGDPYRVVGRLWPDHPGSEL